MSDATPSGGNVPDQGFSVTGSLDGAKGYAAAHGELDVSTAPKFREQLHDLMDQGATVLVVDLGAVSFMDSTALGVLVGTLKRLSPVGGTVELVNPSSHVLRLLQITRLDTVFTVTSPSGAAAVDGPS